MWMACDERASIFCTLGKLRLEKAKNEKGRYLGE
jgi:hypothetical protein